MLVLITGATGFLGTAVTDRFLAAGWSVAALSRDPDAARTRLPASVATHSWPEPGAALPSALRDALRDVDAVVHLAGASIAGGRWTAARKERLRSSRVDTTRRLAEALAAAGATPSAFVSASGMGYYGHRGDVLVSPEDAPGDDFLGGLAAAWEGAAADAARRLGARFACVRLGMVLGAEGGALPKMRIPFRLGLGAVLGSGRQYWPWIHRDDAAEIFFAASGDDSVRGPVHGVSGEPVTNAEFSKTLAGVLRRPLLVRVPAAVLRLGAGELADLFLHGQRALPDARFARRHPALEDALRACLRRG